VFSYVTATRSLLWLSLAILAVPFSLKSSDAVELLMLTTPSCTWCELWEEEVGVIYNLTPQGATAPIRRVDFDNKDLVSFKLPVIYTPTFILFVKGQELGRITGYPGEDHFWMLLDELLKKLTNLERPKCPDLPHKKAQINGNKPC
tara:strand:- start:188 stop:625 length:438 start_codon:yes stop_codon:yes gene_type:complete